MPRDGRLHERPPAPNPPTRDEIIVGQRNQLVAQLLDAEADKAQLVNELTVARRRIAELERQLVAIEPTDAGAAGV